MLWDTGQQNNLDENHRGALTSCGPFLGDGEGEDGEPQTVFYLGSPF